MDTIYALSTPPGRGGIAVIRASGPQACEGLTALSKDNMPLPAPRMASHWTLRDPKDKNAILDRAMVIRFVAPSSFTGEDCIEYHLHGGTAVVESVLEALSKLPHHRLAAPGEFTRRAFENGKMDLTSAEAIADLIHAETQEQKHQALMQMGGALEKIYEGWKDRLAHILALMEADLDFSDQDLPDDLLLKVRPDVSDLLEQINQHLNDNRRGEILRDGVKIVVLGAPNAGKSSLMNALARRDVAIVSHVAGTTRDIIDVHLNLSGYPVILSDTAGLRPDQLTNSDHDQIESEGIRRAIKRAEESDIKILMYDGTADPDKHTLQLLDNNSILVRNKSDLLSNAPKISHQEITISTKTGDGIDNLLSMISDKIKSKIGQSDTPSLTRQRHRTALEKTKDALERSMTTPLPELAAEDIRLGVRYLGSITGKIDVEDLLDMIFRDFCIGK
ncbi:MAG TPA: tRNA uridine-5-carboxymethylaminomethyl(34) synthesis GTPase MnmE [Alphaproteobacteria bacterium]|nr:tRNA uridine-5-carboxymethylaminomethyl(34) synthesis GTPase MnmE [Alphaproteobacteria bacterium]HOO50149.1 tRNA uridine-5-carboxymethylaminomethyl(34) synthesis GTPase MnmE [Alphaproteobacteria bacterium]